MLLKQELWDLILLTFLKAVACMNKECSLVYGGKGKMKRDDRMEGLILAIDWAD